MNESPSQPERPAGATNPGGTRWQTRRKWLLAAAAAVAALGVGVLVWRSTRGGSSDAIQVGAVLPLTGNLASLGEPKRNAFLLAQDAINAEGGIDGRRLEIRFEDNRGEPREGVSALQKLMDLDGVSLFFVDVTAVAMSCAPIADEKERLMFAGSAHPSITEGKKWVFRIFTSGAQEARILADYLAREKVASAYILHVDDALGHDTKDVFAREFAARGGRILGADSFKTGEKNFRSVLAKVQERKPDRLLVFDYGVTLPQILQQCKDAGIRPNRIVGNIGFVGPGVVKLPADLLDGAVFTGPTFTYRVLSNNPEPAMKEFLDGYAARFGAPPDYTAAFVYDTVRILARAAKGTGGNPGAVRQNLLTVKDYPGVSGKISILPNGDSETDMVLARYEGNRIVPLNPVGGGTK